jgi:hypothetical protein
LKVVEAQPPCDLEEHTMPRTFHQIAGSLVLSSTAPILPLIATTPAAAEIKTFLASFRPANARTGGTQYVRIGGQGPAVLLLHGFGDSCRMRPPAASRSSFKNGTSTIEICEMKIGERELLGGASKGAPFTDNFL